MTETSTDLAITDAPDELALAEQARRERKPIPGGNGLLAPARWEMFGRIANTVGDTEFVPRGLRGNKPAVMACLLFGDALGLHPNVALTEVHIVDGRPTMSATLMVGMIRRAGHRIKREEIRDEQGNFIGCWAHGIRGDDGETDDFRFDLQMATRAGLMTKHNWRSYPEAMCWARCVSQLARMLFPDVFLGQSAYTGEELGLEQTTEDGAPVQDSDEKVTLEAAPPVNDDVAAEPAAEPVATFQVLLEEGRVLLGDVKVGGDPLAQLRLSDTHQLVKVEEDGTMIVRQIVPAVEEGEVVDEDFVDGSAEDASIPADEGEPAEVVDVVESAAAPAPTAQEIAFGQLLKLTIPKIMESVLTAQQRGDVDYIKGILAHETSDAGKKRPRLVSALEDAVADMEEAARRYGEQAEAQEELEQQAVALEESRVENGSDVPPVEEPVNAFAAALAARDEPPAPAAAAEPVERPLVTQLKAASRWIQDNLPEPAQKGWKVEQMVVSAQTIWGGNENHASSPIHALDDLVDEELGQIWQAVPVAVKEALAALPADQVTALAAKAMSR